MMKDEQPPVIHGHGDGIEGGGECIDVFPPILDETAGEW